MKNYLKEDHRSYILASTINQLVSTRRFFLYAVFSGA